MRGTELTVLEFLTRFGLAALLGIAIGFERQWRQKRAGLHTEGLIAIGAALFAMLDFILPGDNTRIIAGIVTGVGFLGGGVIFRTEANVTGINTAATIWGTAAIGAFAGLGLWWEASIAAGGVIVMNLILERLEELVNRRADQRGEVIYKFSARYRPESQHAVGQEIFAAISGSPLSLQSLMRHNADGDCIDLRAEIYSPQPDDQRIEGLSTQVLAMAGVVSAEWRSASP
ncbi:MAG TPA: MgtC/SapB family protein [Candidatus Baltobacteraceae bacterium]|jgi:putative Mg2+ transporter-C (MgtC) family protein|nr:MgtC/SapB family protein [Candidatus Baltobacteraceae bacterium]